MTWDDELREAAYEYGQSIASEQYSKWRSAEQKMLAALEALAFIAGAEWARYTYPVAHCGGYDPDRYDKAYMEGYTQGKADAEPKWISVDERLPEVYQDVATQCTDNGGSFYDIDCWRGERWDSGHDVTHWCELPELDHD